MSAGRLPLPEYAHPPLVAATLGVFFENLLPVTRESLVQYQRQAGPEWVGDWSDVSLGQRDWITDVGLISAGWQLKNVLDDRMIRVSPAHFAFTWLGTADTRYPRYENVRDGFVLAWDQFAANFRLPSHLIHKWGVSYLNRIRQGTVWMQPADWSFFKLLPDSPRLAEQIPSAHWQLKIPELRDGLSIEWNVQPSSEEASEAAVWLRLTACGEIGREHAALLDGMDAGRAAIVQTFSDLLSPAANAYWGLRRREK